MRRTDDGTYPNVAEEALKRSEREAVSRASVTETSTTWEHGKLKVMMRTVTTDGNVERTVKVISTQPVTRTYKAPQGGALWEGSFAEFCDMTASLQSLTEEVKREGKFQYPPSVACTIEDDWRGR